MSTIFPDEPAVVAAVRERLALLGNTYFDADALSDDYIYSKVLAAEAEVARQLRVFLQPTQIIPDDAPQSELDEAEDGDMPYATEPAYDYDPQFFWGERWGYIVTQYKPLQSVESIRFSYPAPTNQIFDIPQDWIRMDRRYGHIRLVPASKAFSAPLSSFLMQALGGGRTIPMMIRIRYVAGLKDVFADWPELIDLIFKMAVLKLIQDAFVPQSGSISADGLSESLGMDLDKYSDSLNHKMDDLRDAIHGVRYTVLG